MSESEEDKKAVTSWFGGEKSMKKSQVRFNTDPDAPSSDDEVDFFKSSGNNRSAGRCSDSSVIEPLLERPASNDNLNRSDSLSDEYRIMVNDHRLRFASGNRDKEERRESIWNSYNPYRRRSTVVSVPEDREKLLVDLYEVQQSKQNDIEWTETARWIKYEEHVEGVDRFWSKPRVAFLTFHSLTHLRLCLSKGVILLNQEARTYDELFEAIASEMVKDYHIDVTHEKILRNAICVNREVPTDDITKRKGSIAVMAKKVTNFAKQQTGLKPKDLPNRRASAAAVVVELGKQQNETISSNNHTLTRMKTELTLPDPPEGRRFSRRMTKTLDVMGAQILSGAVQDIGHVRFGIVRLSTATAYPEYRNGTIPLKFVSVLVGPPGTELDYHETGRALATLMANPDFQTIAFTASDRKELVDGIDAFLDEGIMIPPVHIDKGVMNNVDDIRRALRRRRNRLMEKHLEDEQFPVLGSAANETDNEQHHVQKIEEKKNEEHDGDESLQRTGRLFGGLINDLRNRAPYYLSDFKDALNVQCLTSICFMLFAVLAPAITFGGLLEKKTHGWMGVSEVLVAQGFAGFIWSLFAAQPLLIMAETGPFLIFEGSLYEFCASQDIDFMIFRVWVGFWVLIIALITVMFEGSFLIRYVTRFTEDIFTALVSLIFIVESLKAVYKGFVYHPMITLESYCNWNNGFTNLTNIPDGSVYSEYSESTEPVNGTGNHSLAGSDHGHHSLKGQPNTALLSACLVLGTFYLAYQFRQLRTTVFLGRPLRRFVSDFGVPLAIIIVFVVYFVFFSQTYVHHLVIADEFSTTSPQKRGWIIYPIGDDQHPFPIWAYFAAIIPAFLIYILVFVECELSQLLLLRPERKLRKGGGYHWDLMLLGMITFVSGFLGLPWMCAAVLLTLAHGSSLSVLKKRAPGQAPQIDYVVEQRVTTLVVSLLTGACAFLGFILREIPLSVLFGVFLFLGVMTLCGVEMTYRIGLIFVPRKYYPDRPYCQNVSMWRMHFFSLIQIVCLALIYLFKSIKQTSLLFPFIIMIIALFRIFGLPKIFREEELEALDGEDDIEKDEDGEIDIFGAGYRI